MNTLHHGVFRLGRALDFNTSLHLEELQVYGSVPFGASTHDTCSVCYLSSVCRLMWHGRGQESLHLGRVEGEQVSSWKILVPMRLPQ